MIKLIKRIKAKNLSLKIWRKLQMYGCDKTELDEDIKAKMRKHPSWCPLCTLYRIDYGNSPCNKKCPLDCYSKNSFHSLWSQLESGHTYKYRCAEKIYNKIKAWKVWK
jgi:hypothetical protein